ncbi:unnamed protein product [Rotaria sp. Silwood2]|nr:unnamed protein product [Rotaria sp. Silwood2]
MYPQQYPAAEAPSLPYSVPIGSNSLQGTNDDRMRKFQYLVDRYEINREFATRLRGLEGYEIAFIVDDVFFLNRQPLRNITSSEQLTPAFVLPPAGPTPIARILRHVLQEKRLEIQERKLLILIATDGVPTNDSGHHDIKTLEHILRNERNPINRIPVTFIACTDDEESIGYLNKWDKKISNIDVVDDYRSEREEIQKVQGKNFPFSFGDYVVKILMGAIDNWFDTLDEHRVNSNIPPDRLAHKGKKKNTCSIV